MKCLSLRAKLFAVLGVTCIAMVLITSVGLHGMKRLNTQLRTVYEENVLNSQRVAKMTDLLVDTRVQLLLALQHDTSSQFAAMHDHPLDLHTGKVVKNLEEFSRLKQEYQKTTAPAEELKLRETFINATDKVVADGFKPMLELVLKGAYGEAAVHNIKTVNPLFGPASAAAEAIYQDVQKGAKFAYEQGTSNYRRSMAYSVVAVLCSVLVAVVVIVLILKSVAHVAGTLQDVAHGLAEGNLTVRANLPCDNDLGAIAKSFDEMADSFTHFVTTIQKAVLTLSDSAKQTATASERIAYGVEDVASQAVGVATASEEMAATSGDIAQSCTRAADSAQVASERATVGSQVVQETVEGMHRIAERVRDTAHTVEALGQRSDQIGAIIGTIEDIADQTNLLALNAAIEAARAGEMGRGFAVVADEVRALAERTTRATREIGEMIKAIQQETKGAVVAMEEGVTEVERGTEGAARSGEVLQEILAQIQDVTMQVSQIATAAEEQTATTSEITCNIQKINQVAQHSSVEAHTSAQASLSLDELAEQLQADVRRFKTAESELFILELAKGDHRKFVDTVEDVVNGHKTMQSSALSTHTTCRFGKWYGAEGRQMCGTLPAFRAIDPPHEKIHAIARDAVEAANRGDKDRAEAIVREMKQISGQIVDLLDQIGREARTRG